MPIITYLGDDSEQPVLAWGNIRFPVNQPVKIEASDSALAKHIIETLSGSDNPYFKIEDVLTTEEQLFKRLNDILDETADLVSKKPKEK